MYILGGVGGVEIGQIKSNQIGFLADTNMDDLTSEWPGTPNFKVDANFDMFPQIMGKNLQNELWTRPVPSKLSERWPPTLFL